MQREIPSALYNLNELDIFLVAVAPCLGMKPFELRAALLQGDERARDAVWAIRAMAPDILRDMIVLVTNSVEEDDRQGALAQLPFLERLARAVQDEPVLGQAEYLRGYVYRRQGLFFQAIDAFRRALDHGGDASFRSRSFSRLGTMQRIVGDYDDAAASFISALALETQAEGRARILGNVAMTMRNLGEFGQAETAERQVASLLGAVAEDGYALDAAAQRFAALGDNPWSLELNRRAKTWFEEQGRVALPLNAEIRSDLLHKAGRAEEAVVQFRLALDLYDAQARTSINRQHYVDGWHRSRSSGEAARAAAYNVYAHATGSGSLSAVDRVIGLATGTGDAALVLRARAFRGGMLFDAGQLAEATAELEEVSAQAGDLGLALPEYSSLVTLSAVSQSGGEVQRPILQMLCRAGQLRDMMATFLGTLGMSRMQFETELNDTGAIESQLGSYASKREIWPVAAYFYEKAMSRARLGTDSFKLANRLVGLHRAASQAGDVTWAGRAASDLRSLARQDGLPDRTRLVAARALEGQDRSDNPALAACWIEMAARAAEAIRAATPPSHRENVDRQWNDVYGTLAQARREQGRVEDAFAAVQLGRLRGFADRIAARAGCSDSPPGLATLQACLDGLDRLLDVAVERNGLALYLVSQTGIEATLISCDPGWLMQPEAGDVHERAEALLALARENGGLAALAEWTEARLPPSSTLLIAPDPRLGNLPWSSIIFGDRAWSDCRRIGIVPAAAALLTRQGARTGRVLVMGDARGDLPAARDECTTIASLYRTRSLVGTECSTGNLYDALASGPLDILHLATHGRGNPYHGGMASLALVDGSGKAKWTDLAEILDKDWPVGLVVLSGCSTGLIGRKDTTQAISLAETVLRAGARAVVACLWPVGDTAAQIMMEAFHRELSGFGQPGNGIVSDRSDVLAALEFGRKTLTASLLPLSPARDGRGRLFGRPGALDKALDQAAFIALGMPRPFS